MSERHISQILSCVAPLSNLLCQLGMLPAMVGADAGQRRPNITWTFVLNRPQRSEFFVVHFHRALLGQCVKLIPR